jgi:hypothetical protein
MRRWLAILAAAVLVTLAFGAGVRWESLRSTRNPEPQADGLVRVEPARRSAVINPRWVLWQDYGGHDWHALEEFTTLEECQKHSSPAAGTACIPMGSMPY